jgi:hypothetical protein
MLPVYLDYMLTGCSTAFLFIYLSVWSFTILQALHETARLEVDKSMLTDAPLLFPPGQVLYAMFLHVE